MIQEKEIALLLWEVVKKTTLFAVEATEADSEYGLKDGTEKFLGSLKERPKWSISRYGDVIRVLQHDDRDAIPPYLLTLLQETQAKILSLCNSSQHNLNIDKSPTEV